MTLAGASRPPFHIMEANMAEKQTDQKVAVILHFDVWDEDGNRLPAAPVTGTNEAGHPVREEVTMVSRAIAEKFVKSGKASVPLQ